MLDRLLRSLLLFFVCASVVAGVHTKQDLRVVLNSVPVPKSATSFDVGGVMYVNGNQTIIKGYLIDKPSNELIVWYKKNISEKYQIATLPNGGKVFSFYKPDNVLVTIQVNSLKRKHASAYVDGASKLLYSAVRYQNKKNNKKNAGVWGELPYGVRIVSTVESFEDGKSHAHVVYEGGRSIDAVSSFFIQRMKKMGYDLKSTNALDRKEKLKSVSDGVLLFFAGAGKETSILIHQNHSGKIFSVYKSAQKLNEK